MPNKEWKVPSDQAGMKLGEFLKSNYGTNCSARQIKRFLDQDFCKVNGHVERYPSSLLSGGDSVTLFIPEEPLSGVFAFEPLRVLYEDDALLAYDKPPRINSDEAGIGKVLKSYNRHLSLVHRLDQETSGVLLFAKDRKTEEALLNGFKQRQMLKEYLAIVDGIPKSSEGHIENNLIPKASLAGQTLWGVAGSSTEGKKAITDWRLEKEGKGASLVRCFPKTGRTHQLRVHLNFIGHPILGDYQYSKHFSCPYHPPRLLLHAERLSFLHPFKKEIVRCKAPLPDDFLKALQSLEINV